MAGRYAKVVLFGDSITQWGYSVPEGGWCAAVTDHFQRRADFIHRGFSGYTTRWAKQILPKLVHAGCVPDCILIFFGGNDAASNDLHCTPLDEYKQNLTDMCTYLISLGMTKQSILLVTPSPASDDMWTKVWNMPGDRTLEATERYAKGAREVGNLLGVGVVDIHSKMMAVEDYRVHLSDGLHLNREGNAVMAKLVIEALQPSLERFETVLVKWNKIDTKEYRDQLVAACSKL